MGDSLVLEERLSDLINLVSSPLCLLCGFLQTGGCRFVDASETWTLTEDGDSKPINIG